MSLDINNEILINKNLTSVSTTSNVQRNTNDVSTSAELQKSLSGTENAKILKQLDISAEEYKCLLEKYPDFNKLNLDAKLELVKNFKVEQQVQTKAVDLENNNQDVEQLTTTGFNKAEYNKMSADEKINACINEFVRNNYIYGKKDEAGDGYLQREKEWNNFTQEQKQEYVDKFLKNIDNNEKLKDLKEILLSKTNSKQRSVIADTVMRGIETATNSQMSYLEFLQLDENFRLDLVDMYFKEGNNKDFLNESDKQYIKTWDIISSEVLDYVKDRRELPENFEMCNSDTRDFIKYYNLNEDELIYNALKKQQMNGQTLSSGQENFIKLMDSPAMTRQIDKAKLANLSSSDYYAELKTKIDNGEQLTETEKNDYNQFVELQQRVKLPEPKTEMDKVVVEDLNVFNNQIKDHVKGADTQSAALMAMIETKTKDMKPSERKEYIKSVLTFYNGAASTKVFSAYAKEFPDMWGDERLVGVAALNEEEATEAQSKENMAAIKRAYDSNDAYFTQEASSALVTKGQILARPENKRPEFNRRKVYYSQVASSIDNTEGLKQATSVNATITDVKEQLKAQNFITNSEYANDEVHIDTTNKAHLFMADVQDDVVIGAMEKSKAATANVAENNIIKDLDKTAQTPVFKAAHSFINKQFNENDAIKYSKALADQIQYCDKDNQLTMHNDIMQSKYSEVQEHAAANIKDYDPAVQGKALDSVYATNNDKAIDAAVESLSNTASADVIQQNFQKIVTEACVKTLDNNPDVLNIIDVSSKDGASIKEKIASGAKLSTQEYASLSPAQKREYITNFFKNLPPNEKLKLLNSISSQSQKRSIYRMIARTNSDLFNRMINDADIAATVLDMHLSSEIDNKILAVVERKKNSDNSFMNVAKDYAQADNTVAKEGLYSTNPYGFDAKEFLKDRKGNLMV